MASRMYAVFAILLLAGAHGCAKDRAAVDEAEIARAQGALGPFKKQMMEALTAALSESPMSAIEVCKTRAPEIAAAVSGEGVRIGRTSHKLRNPGNAPEPWMEPLLNAYVDNPENRESRAVRIDDHTVGYVEPIHVKAPCLVCHGEVIADPIKERLDALYAQDRARGFREGDFRGMFWVTMESHGPRGD